MPHNPAVGGVYGQDLVRARGGGDEGFVIGADFNCERGGKGFLWNDSFRRKRFQVDEVRFVGGVFLKVDAGDLVEEGAVLKFGEAVFFGAGSAVDVVAGIGLGNEDRAFGVDSKSVKKGS